MALITAVSRVSNKGQLVIPREVRQALDVRRGDRVEWTVDERGVLNVSLSKTDLMAVKGRLPSRGKSVSVEDMQQAIQEGATESS